MWFVCGNFDVSPNTGYSVLPVVPWIDKNE